MVSLVEFLTARLDEDEAVARDAEHPTDLYDSAAEAAYQRAANEGAPLRGLRHFNRWRPARVLAEVEAKRRILRAATEGSPVDQWMSTMTLDWVLFQMVQPYADHPDYDEAWRP